MKKKKSRRFVQDAIDKGGEKETIKKMNLSGKKTIARAEIDEAMEEFFERGGKITRVVPADRDVKDIFARDQRDYANDFLNEDE